jgi:hypothetical protein
MVGAYDGAELLTSYSGMKEKKRENTVCSKDTPPMIGRHLLGSTS